MARRGGYTRNVEGIEWAKLAETMDSEGKLSARDMGQSYFVWLNDAVEHHVYRCEMIMAQERYQADMAHATETLSVSPMPYDAKYQVNRPKPTITRDQPGPGGSTGSSRGPRARP